MSPPDCGQYMSSPARPYSLTSAAPGISLQPCGVLVSNRRLCSTWILQELVRYLCVSEQNTLVNTSRSRHLCTEAGTSILKLSVYCGGTDHLLRGAADHFYYEDCRIFSSFRGKWQCLSSWDLQISFTMETAGRFHHGDWYIILCVYFPPPQRM